VHKTLTLPNGTILPKGTVFEVAIQPANMRNPKLDRPAEWMGLRYHDLREQGGFSDKLRREYEWSASTRDDMSFGYGSHVCPGKAQGCGDWAICEYPADVGPFSCWVEGYTLLTLCSRGPILGGPS
jgi:hypothetical protein